MNFFLKLFLSNPQGSLKQVFDFFHSLGGFTALTVAVGLPEQVTGVALLNSAGQFAAESRKREEADETVIAKFIVKPLKEIFQRVVLGFLFWQAKQPSRIESVLKSVMSY